MTEAEAAAATVAAFAQRRCAAHQQVQCSSSAAGGSGAAGGLQLPSTLEKAKAVASGKAPGRKPLRELPQARSTNLIQIPLVLQIPFVCRFEQISLNLDFFVRQGNGYGKH